MRELKKELWPYRVPLNSDWKDEITLVELWLGQQFGTFRGRWNVVYHYNRTDFYFKNAADATLFALKWA
jgi:hypothetical protein